MLKIVEKICESPIRIFAKPGIKLVPGYIGTLVEYNGNLVCDICKPGQMPFGVIGSRRFVKTESICFAEKELVSLWPQRMIFRTDRFESGDYKEGDKLYLGESGRLTNIDNGAEFLARLISYPNKERKYYEALWL